MIDTRPSDEDGELTATDIPAGKMGFRTVAASARAMKEEKRIIKMNDE